VRSKDIDTANLALATLADGGVRTLPDGNAFLWDTSSVHVKGSRWVWQDATMYDNGTHADIDATVQIAASKLAFATAVLSDDELAAYLTREVFELKEVGNGHGFSTLSYLRTPS